MLNLSTRAASARARIAPLAIATALAAFAAPGLAQDAPAPGFARTSLRALGNTTTTFAALTNGTVVRFDGTNVDLEADDGTFLMNLGSLPGFAFPSFVEIDPTETFALIGESSFGDVYRVDLAMGGLTFVANFPFNYDAVFEASGNALLTIAVEETPGTFVFDTEIYRMSPVTGASRLVATASGPNGGLALDAGQNLVVARANDDFGTSFDIVRWTQAQLTSGVVVDESFATTLVTGLAGGGSLALEPTNGHLFVAAGCDILELDLDTGAVVGTVTGFSTCPAFTFFISGLQVLPANNGATLQPFQPAGPQLRYSSTDFGSSTSEYASVTGARPQFTVTHVMGQTTLSVTGGLPNGAWNLIWNPVDVYSSVESIYDLGLGFPLFTGMDITRLFRLPFNLPLDANGAGSLTYLDAAVDGTLGLQAILYALDGTVLGTSHGATN